MFCSKCGTKVTDDSIYCYKCGAKIAKTISNAESTTAGMQDAGEFKDGNNPKELTKILSKEIDVNDNNRESDGTPVKKWSTMKTVLVVFAFIVAGYLFFPGILYYNAVIWGSFSVGVYFVKQYWKERAFLKVIAVAVCTILVMGIFAGLKDHHKKMVRANVLSKYSRTK